MKNSLTNSEKTSIEEPEFLQEFIAANAILRGHFVLSSGLHSDTYMQCAKLLMNPVISRRVCTQLSLKLKKKFGENFADLVVSPAMGGVIVGYEMASCLGLSAIFCERVNGVFELRRGFEIPSEARVLMVEDVITTGKSSLETIELIKKQGGNLVGACSLVDRSDNLDLTKKFGVPVVSLLKISVKTFSANNVPTELKSIPAIKPGSRFLGQEKTSSISNS